MLQLRRRGNWRGQLSLFDDQDIDSCSDADQFEFQFEENETLR